MQQQQPYYPPPQPAIGYFALIVIGIILMMVSGVLISLILVMTSDQDIVMMLGIILNEVGLGIMSIGLTMGALKDENLHQHTRVAMFLAMGLVIAFVHFKLISYSYNWF